MSAIKAILNNLSSTELRIEEILPRIVNLLKEHGYVYRLSYEKRYITGGYRECRIIPGRRSAIYYAFSIGYEDADIIYSIYLFVSHGVNAILIKETYCSDNYSETILYVVPLTSITLKLYCVSKACLPSYRCGYEHHYNKYITKVRFKPSELTLEIASLLLYLIVREFHVIEDLDIEKILEDWRLERDWLLALLLPRHLYYLFRLYDTDPEQSAKSLEEYLERKRREYEERMRYIEELQRRKEEKKKKIGEEAAKLLERITEYFEGFIISYKYWLKWFGAAERYFGKERVREELARLDRMHIKELKFIVDKLSQFVGRETVDVDVEKIEKLDYKVLWHIFDEIFRIAVLGKIHCGDYNLQECYETVKKGLEKIKEIVNSQ